MNLPFLLLTNEVEGIVLPPADLSTGFVFILNARSFYLRNGSGLDCKEGKGENVACLRQQLYGGSMVSDVILDPGN